MNESESKATTEDETTRAAIVIVNCALNLAREKGLPLAIVTKELALAAAAGQVKQLGPKMAARCFRELADNIEAGMFDAIGGEAMRH